MRFWHVCLLLSVGCAHAKWPAGPDASGYWKLMQSGAYAKAAGEARRARLDPWHVRLAFRYAHEGWKNLDKRIGSEIKDVRDPLVRRYTEGGGWDINQQIDEANKRIDALTKRKHELLLEEIGAACHHGVDQEAKEMAVQEALDFAKDNREFGTKTLYVLQEEGCPFGRPTAERILAVAKEQHEFAVAAGLMLRPYYTPAERAKFLDELFAGEYCNEGIRAALRFGTGEDEIVGRFARNPRCESEHSRILIAAFGIQLRPLSAEEFRNKVLPMRLFMAAVKTGKYECALDFLGPSGLEDDGMSLLIDEMLKRKADFKILEIAKDRPAFRDAAFARALAAGRTRFVAFNTNDAQWIRKALDQALELGAYEDAAEIAEYAGNEEPPPFGALQVRSPPLADRIRPIFEKAMRAKDFAAGRRLMLRYKIPQDEYDRLWREAQGIAEPPASLSIAPSPPKPEIKKRRLPPCPPDADEWQIRRCEKR